MSPKAAPITVDVEVRRRPDPLHPLIAAAMSLGLMVGVAWGVFARHVGPIPAICIQLLAAALAAACLWWLWRATR